MAASIVIRLAGEPKGKGRPRFSRSTGHAFTPAATRSYEAALRYAAQETMGSRRLFSGPVEVWIVAAMPIPKSFSKAKRLEAVSGVLRPTKKPDWDNLAKITDALNGVVFDDDVLIVEGHVRKIYAEKPELTVEVRAA